MDFYILLDDDTIRNISPDRDSFWDWFEDIDNRRIAYSEANGVVVSTVFLGFEHGVNEKGEPLLFETMVFTDYDDANDYCDRAASVKEAKEAHVAACEQVFGYRHKCTKCGMPCDVVEKVWKERENFWGAPCYRTEYEDVSECCGVEFEELY